MKNDDVLGWICTQAEIVLLEFADGLESAGFIITNLSQYELVLQNRQHQQTIKFIFANKYTYGLGIQPLQNIIIESQKGSKSLSEVVDSKEGKGAFRNYLINRGETVSRTAVFYDLYSRYFGEDVDLS